MTNVATASSITPALLLERITCTFASREEQGERYTAVADATVSVGPGEFVSVVGPTGCGCECARAEREPTDQSRL